MLIVCECVHVLIVCECVRVSMCVCARAYVIMREICHIIIIICHRKWQHFSCESDVACVILFVGDRLSIY